MKQIARKCLREWQRADLVKTDGMAAKLLDPAELEALAVSDDSRFRFSGAGSAPPVLVRADTVFSRGLLSPVAGESTDLEHLL